MLGCGSCSLSRRHSQADPGKHTVAMAEMTGLVENPQGESKAEDGQTAEPRCSLSQLEDNLSEANVQLAEVEKSQAEINAIRLQAESSHLSWEHEEAQSRLNQNIYIMISLTLQANDVKRQWMKSQRTKLTVRLPVAEETAESLQAWVASTEKTRQRLQKEVEDLRVDLEKTRNPAIQEHIQHQPDQLRASTEIPGSLSVRLKKVNCFACSSIWLRLKLTLTEEHEKEEFETTRNNHQHATESLQASLETGAKGSAEALRLKKMDTDLSSMEMHLDCANTNHSELLRTLNKLQQHVKDLRIERAEDACWHKEQLQTEREEEQTGLEGSERSRKLLEQAEVMEKT
ncbi:hypothetical protein Q9233_004897 [Columba guinea]|nr:hypothetical protein Q9233_004897 [Columba guinea]